MNPFRDLPPQEVPLDRAPLDFVICQVRFPSVLSIGRDEFVASFQEALRRDYPFVESQIVQQLQLASMGGDVPAMPQPATKTYQFFSSDRRWNLTLSPDFLALQTNAYKSRREFMARLEQAIAALADHIGPTHSTRLGVRYFDRIKGEDLKLVNEFLRPELLGLMAAGEASTDVDQLISQALFSVPEGKLAVRWGLLPQGMTIDPIAIKPEGVPSWILDLDCFTDAVEPFDATKLVQEARHLSERIYTFFRWAVLPPFLSHYRG